MTARSAGVACAAAKRSSAGFSLIEVVLVIVIAGVALLPLSMLFANASIRSGDARNTTVAVELAQSKLEEISADKNSPLRGMSFLVAGNYPAENPVTTFPNYNRSVTFSPDSTYDGVTFRTVTVTVTNTNIPAVSLTTWFTTY